MVLPCINMNPPQVYTKQFIGTSLVVQGLRLHAPNAGALGLIPGQGTRSQMPQLRSAAAAAKSLESCPTLCDPIDGSPSGSLDPGILQARILEWVAISFSRGSSWLRDGTRVSCIAGTCFTVLATTETNMNWIPGGKTIGGHLGDFHNPGNRSWKKVHRTLTLCQYGKWRGAFAVVQSGPTLHDCTDCNTPGLPVPHHLLEPAQVHFSWISDAIQPSHP